MSDEQKKWFNQKIKELLAAGWRKHGEKVGGKVLFLCEGDYIDDELIQEINGSEQEITMLIADRTIGEIIGLQENGSIVVKLPCSISYWDDDDLIQEIDDEQEIEGDISDLDNRDTFIWSFELIEGMKSGIGQPIQLSFSELKATDNE